MFPFILTRTFVIVICLVFYRIDSIAFVNLLDKLTNGKKRKSYTVTEKAQTRILVLKKWMGFCRHI